MAKREQKSTPSETPAFLGGASQFNKAGAQISSRPGGSEEPVVVIPPLGTRARILRTVLIVLGLMILAVLLFLAGSDRLGGIRHTPGRGGISPTSHTAAPPSNF